MSGYIDGLVKKIADNAEAPTVQGAVQALAREVGAL